MKRIYFITALLGFFLSGFVFVTTDLPTDQSTLFSGSGNCTRCHAGSTGVLINSAGRDVSPVYHWQSSMMVNSAKDPYWQAKVSFEVAENPHLQSVIEDKCATCHAPMGRTEAIYTGQEYYSFNEVKSNNLSLDGVSCTVCHQIDSENLNTMDSFSGHYSIKATKTIYGPYQNPFTTSMVNNTGYTPAYGAHIASAGLCATCHTLITPYVDENGDVAGNFPEQMPYYEWLNSSYPAQEKTCQDCHMPKVNEDFTIAALPANLQNKRNPVYEHHFVGGNLTINQLINKNYTELGINSNKANLDTTAYYTNKNLMENSIELSASAQSNESMMTVTVELKNKTGHKLPTGFPSRRLWLHFTATDNENNVVFESGKYDANGIIASQAELEIHHDTISNANEVQIYEAILGTTKNEVTTTLIKAAKYLKDNRIPPEGFKIGMPYDTLIAITGNAVDDKNFNQNASGEHGTGADQIKYRFPYSGGVLNYKLEVCYQSINPMYASHLSDASTNEAERFTQMYNNEITKVHVISQLEQQWTLSNANNIKSPDWKIYPNPTKDKVYLSGNFEWPVDYSFYSMNGKLVSNGKTDVPIIPIRDLSKGTYFLSLKSKEISKSIKVVCN